MLLVQISLTIYLRLLTGRLKIGGRKKAGVKAEAEPVMEDTQG